MRIPYRLEIVVFLAGAAVMMLEMAGSRVLAPYVGTSIYIWTSLIGVVLASLSVGYWLGGWVSDRHPEPRLLSLIIAAAAIWIALASYFHGSILTTILSLTTDIRLSAILGAIILFTPSSVFLGMVSPFAARLAMKTVKHSGATIGNLSAISTAGSIAGTFISGFLLIAMLGTANLLYAIAGTLLATSLLLGFKADYVAKAVIAAVIVLLMVSHQKAKERGEAGGFIDADTLYNRVWIYTNNNFYTGEPERVMQINNERSSAAFIGSDRLAYPYTRFYRLVEVFYPSFSRTLMIGGAGYSFPQYYVKNYPKAAMDVVEIDPGVTALAQKHFGLKPNPRLNIIHEDGRTYLNRTRKTYDTILGDAFKSSTVPYHLTTAETAKRMHDILAPKGIVIINLIGSVTGDDGRLVRAEYRTFKQYFPQVFLYPVNPDTEGNEIQNIMLVALKSRQLPAWKTNDPELKEFLTRRWTKPVSDDIPILTDDFAPVDYYTKDIL